MNHQIKLILIAKEFNRKISNLTLDRNENFLKYYILYIILLLNEKSYLFFLSISFTTI